jgi:hypothetical protein
MSSLLQISGDRGERLGQAAVAATKARRRHATARTLARGVRYLEPALVAIAAGVWLWALLALAG